PKHLRDFSSTCQQLLTTAERGRKFHSITANLLLEHLSCERCREARAGLIDLSLAEWLSLKSAADSLWEMVDVGSPELAHAALEGLQMVFIIGNHRKEIPPLKQDALLIKLNKISSPLCSRQARTIAQISLIAMNGKRKQTAIATKVLCALLRHEEKSVRLA